MPNWLRQSTSVDVPIGPFLDATDGNTIEDTLTITQPDIRLKKNDGAWAQKAAAQTLTHEENGWYEVTLDATDTNTLGRLLMAVHESGARAVSVEYMVIPANVYDSFVLGTDLIDVNLAQYLGTAPVAMVSNRPSVHVGAMLADVITSSTLAASVTTELQSGLATAAGLANVSIGPGGITSTSFAAGAIDGAAFPAMSEMAQGNPTATPDIPDALMYLYMAFRNASKATATERQVLNNAGTVIAKAPMSDDGTTFDQGKLVTGP